MNRRTRIRHKAAVFLAAAVVISGVLAVPLSALAASGPFVIDGDVPDDGAAELPDLFGSVKELGPLNSNTTKIGVIHSDAVPTLGKTNPNAQVDLRRAWLDTGREAASDDDWLYFGWERDSNSGSGFIAYEFMQDPPPAACDYADATEAALIAGCNPWANRQDGDFMILWDQQGNSLDLYLRTWSGTAPNLVLSDPDLLDDTVSEAAYSADGFRGEAALNLTDTIFGGSTECLSFANTIPSTVTGNSDTADYKDTILQTAPPISNCTSSIVTTPKTGAGGSIPAQGLSIGTGVVSVKDEAVVSLDGGTATPAGSVAFFLCKVDDPDLCTSGGTSVGSTNLSGASYPATVLSPIAYVTAAGRYCWRSEFTGDSANGIPGSSESAAAECFTVNPATPALATTAGADVLLGNPVTDNASLTGLAKKPADPIINTTGASGAAAGGTITFTLYGPNDCSTVAYTSSAIAISSTGTASASFAPTAPGTYHWAASYSGDSPNNNGDTHNGDCSDTNETVVVNTVPSSMSTAQSWVPNDSATISATAGGNLVGKVHFKLYASNNCTGTVVYSTPPAGVTVSGPSPQTVSTANSTSVSTSGFYSWQVSYDSTNPAQDDIAASCKEVTNLTIDDDITSP